MCTGAARRLTSIHNNRGDTYAVVIRGKANALVTALVDGVIMPVVTFFVSGGTWRTATFSKQVLREETVTKK